MQVILPANFQLFDSILAHVRSFLGISLVALMLYSAPANAEDGNLLVNPGAESDYTGWVRSNGGDGWSTTFSTPHSGSRCWSSSYDPCRLTQTIDLVALGYDTLMLDAAPVISFGSYVNTNVNSSGYVTIRIDLLNSANAVIKTGFAVNNQEMNHHYWLLKYATLSGYGTGLRKIRFTLVGEGTRYWGDQYGPSFDDAFVYLLTQTKAITDDPTLISPRSATFNGVVYPNEKTSSVAFEYGTSIAFGSTVVPSQSPVSGSAPVAVSNTVILPPGKTYFYRLISYNSSDTSRGVTRTFKTPAVILTPSATSLAIGDTAGCKATVNITSTVSWSASVDVPWLSVSQTSGPGNASLTLTVDANPTPLPRIATLTLKGDTLADRIVTITQNKGAIHIIPTTMTMDSDADTLSLKVRTIFKWAAVTNVPWIKVPSDSISGSLKLIFSISENAGNTNRTGTITLSNKYISKVFTIVQNKGVFILTPASYTVGAHNDSYEIKVGTNFTWAAASNVPWIGISSDSVNGTAVTVFTVEENITGLARTGIITISNSRISGTLNVRQGILKGAGTADEPYLISDYNGLKYVKNNLNAHYQLTNDIDAGLSVSENGGLGFEPIGSSSNPFTGSINGNDYAIKNLHIQRTNSVFIGLIGYGKNATLRNLGLTNCSIKGYGYAGGLAGLVISSSFHNCYVSGTISGGENIGGMMGLSSGSSVTNCYVAGKVTGQENFGGIAGYIMNTTVTNSYSIADLTGGDYGGGLIGRNDMSTITNCYAAGKISGTSIKGLIGYNMGGSVVSCYYDSEVSLMHDTGIGIPLSTTDMKSKISFASWDFNNVWTIRGDSTYPGLRTLNNAPFAFADTLEVTGYTRIQGMMENDFDIEMKQTNLVPKMLRITGNGTLKNGWYTFPAGTVAGTINSLIYKIGEVLASGDTLWGNESSMALKKVANASPTALNDTITTFSDVIASFDVSRILANDADSNGNIIYPDTIYTPRNGNLSFRNDTITYTPEAGWNGIDSVLYVITDGDLYDTAIISIIVVKVSEITWENAIDISYGTALGAAELNASTGIPGTFIYSPQPATVLHAGNSQILTVKFIPEDTVIFTKASKSVLLNVNKVDLTITANDHSIFLETPIPDLTYTCDGFVNGENISDLDELPVISTTATETSDVGQYSISLTGGSDENYNFIFLNGVLDISLNDPPVALNDTVSVLKGEISQFSKSTLLANDFDPEGYPVVFDRIIPGYPKNGTLIEDIDMFSYSSEAGWNGIDSILYVITDGNGTDTAVISIYVTMVPEIIWEDPNEITYGTALGSTQLNATTGITVPGTFHYIPQTGMVLNAGDSQELSVEFIPEDSLLYKKAARTVHVNVKKADLTIIADNQSIMMGSQLPELTLTYEGFVNGDLVTDLDELPVVSTDATELSNAGNYDITLSGGNDNNYNYILQNGILEVTINTGIGELREEMSVYPNPFTDYIYLQGWQPGIVYTITNTSGNIMKKGVLENNRINLSHLNAGVYILHIHIEGTVRNVKIVKR